MEGVIFFPTPQKKLGSAKLSENLLVGEFSSENAKFGTKTGIFKKLRDK